MFNFQKKFLNSGSAPASDSATQVSAQASKNPAQSIATDEIKSTDGKLKKIGAQNAKSLSVLQGQKINVKIFEPEDLLDYLEIKQGDKVLDMGCGIGRFVILIAKIFKNKNVEVYGADVQKDLLVKMLKEAKQEGLQNVKAVLADLDKYKSVKLPDHFFDKILVINTLFQISDKDSFFKEVARLIKKRGELYIVDWLDSASGLGPPKDMLVSKEWLAAQLVDNGYMLSEDFTLKDHHFLLKFVKL